MIQIILLLMTVISSVTSQCTIGEPVEPTEAFITNGQYINLNDPASCSGNLTAWNFCYYRSSIDTTASRFSIFLRVWRKRQGNTYDLISTAEVRGTPNQNGGELVCVNAILTEDQYIAVEQGDVIAVYMPFTIPTVSVLATGPAITQELHQDTRGNAAFSSTQFRRSDLQPVSIYGLHLQAFIFATPTMAPTVMGTTLPPTTMGTMTTVIETTIVDNGGMQETTVDTNPGAAAERNSTPIIAAIIVVVLLLILTAVAVLIIAFICYQKRKHGTLKGCLQRGKSNLLAIDNLIYRVGSDRIPIKSPKSNARPVSNSSSQHYDIPRDRHDRTLYNIPQNSTPSLVEKSQSYSIVKPVPQPASTVHTNNVGEKDGAQNGNGHVSESFLQSTGDYIFMDNSDTEIEEKDENEGQFDDEVYIHLSYGSVEYHKLLSEATDKDGESDSPFYNPPSSEDEIYVVLSEQHIKVIPRKAVQIDEKLGSGHFGNVHKGTWTGSKGTLQVAAKSVSEGASQTDKVRLLQEAAIMGQFKHPNITNLHGIVTQGGPILLLMEYIPKGDLKKYLTKLRPEPGSLVQASTPHLLVSFSQQVALGMHYLASKGFVHRDLAARNVFISAEDTCKIGDFGMSRDLSENGCYNGRGGKVPLKWMAPEAVHRRVYSIASDVWSYGCVLFEIWSLGRKPFRGIENSKTLNMIDSGYRLPPPPGCPFRIYDLMIKCWHPVASSRPKYRDVLTCLLQDEAKVLDIPVSEASSHPQACVLGLALEAGEGMYMGLQQCYKADASDQYDPDYEYGETD